MQKIKQILNDLLNTGSITPENYIYLQQHKQEVMSTGNIELMELTNCTDIKEPNYTFKKVLF